MRLETTIRLELTSADPQGVLDEMLQQGLSLYSVYPIDELTTAFTVNRTDLLALRSILDVRGDVFRIVREQGVGVFMTRIKRRPVLLMGLAFLVFLTVFIPTRLILFRVDGNETISSSLILEAVCDQGIRFGAKRKNVRSEEIKNELIARIPQIAWAGINTKGCVATVSVRERSDEKSGGDLEPGSIYAARDGIVSSVTAARGTALCAPGDSVLKGQLLISGYTDCGDILLLEAAEGEVYAYTSRTSTVVLPKVQHLEHSSGIIRHRYSLVIGKKRINFWKGSGISPTGYDRMYQEYWLKLPGGGILPVCIIRETVIFQELEPCGTEWDDAEMSDVMDMYVLQQIPGGKILHRQIHFMETGDIVIFSGQFGCYEMIGKKKVEQIGDNVWQER